MAKRAGLELRGLVVEAGRVAHDGAKRNGVTLKTEQIHFAALEQARIGRAVRHVATDAAFSALRRVLKDKRPGLFGVAFQANGIAGRRGAELRAQQPAVLVVAVGAGHQLFIHAMMERLGEFGGDFLMASVAKLRLRFSQNEFLCSGMMDGVTVNATQVAGLVCRAEKIAVFLTILMAGEAVGGDVFCSDAAKREDFCRIASLGVLAAGAMAALAGISFTNGLRAERYLAVRSGVKCGEGIGMTFLAFRGTDIVGGLGV